MHNEPTVIALKKQCFCTFLDILCVSNLGLKELLCENVWRFSYHLSVARVKIMDARCKGWVNTWVERTHNCRWLTNTTKVPQFTLVLLCIGQVWITWQKLINNAKLCWCELSKSSLKGSYHQFSVKNVTYKIPGHTLSQIHATKKYRGYEGKIAIQNEVKLQY